MPESFRKTEPRFPGQYFDLYVQKSDNLQIWNQDVVPSRRYVLVRLNEQSQVSRVKVVGGEVLASLDTTGTLTRKFQARRRSPIVKSVLVSNRDTKTVTRTVKMSPKTSHPILPVATLYGVS